MIIDSFSFFLTIVFFLTSLRLKNERIDDALNKTINKHAKSSTYILNYQLHFNAKKNIFIMIKNRKRTKRKCTLF